MLEDLCLKIINENYNTYFKCKEIVDEIIALKYDTTVSYIVHSKRSIEYQFEKPQKEFTPKVRNILKNLEKEGLIIKYNSRFWKKVNHGEAKIRSG